MTSAAQKAASARWWRKKKTGWGRAEYDSAMELQGGLCAICEASCNAGALCADHDHKTGAKRALLCRRCNAGLGYFKDDQDLCFRAAQYLDNYKGQVLEDG